MNLVDVNNPPLHVMDGDEVTIVVPFQIVDICSWKVVKIVATANDDLKNAKGLPIGAFASSKETSMLHVKILKFFFILLVLLNEHGPLHLYQL